MPTIKEFSVVEPPTSGEVVDRFHRKLPEGFLPVVLRGQHEVPRPIETEVTVRIRGTDYPEEGGIIIRGEDNEGSSIVIRTNQDPSLPATASMVTP